MPVIHLEFDDAVVSKEEATAVGGQFGRLFLK